MDAEQVRRWMVDNGYVRRESEVAPELLEAVAALVGQPREPSPEQTNDARDAARYRLMRDTKEGNYVASHLFAREWDSALDAIAACDEHAKP